MVQIFKNTFSHQNIVWNKRKFNNNNNTMYLKLPCFNLNTYLRNDQTKFLKK